MAVRLVVGQGKDITSTVKNIAGQLVNPATFELTIYDDDDLSIGGTTYVYGVDVGVTRPSTGTFLMSYTFQTPGVWKVYAKATSPNCSSVATLIVEDRR